MEISTPQKIKLLKLMELLRENSDEDHPLKTNVLCTMLKNAGISCDRRTLSRDIATLNECGYEIFSTMQSHDKAYYIVERSFSLPELKILIDAVQAASFITESKTENLIQKIAALGNAHRAELLQGGMVCFNSRKHSNEQIYYSVETLEGALRRHQKVSFCYFDLVKHYGDVPYGYENNNVEDYSLTSRFEIYDNLIEILKEAEALMYPLGEGGITAERFSKGFADALLGQIALYSGGYQTIRTDVPGLYGDVQFTTKGKEELGCVYARRNDYLDYYKIAEKYFQAALNNKGTAALVTVDDRSYANNPFQRHFQYTHDLALSPESIFEVGNIQGGQSGQTTTSEYSYAFGRPSSGGSNQAAPCKSFGALRIIPSFYYGEFEAGDMRRDASVTVTGSKGDGNEALLSFAPGSKLDGGIAINKWDENRMNPPYTTSQRTSGMNWPVLRLADLILMQAEVKAELGAEGEAIQLLNQIRQRAFGNAEHDISASGEVLKEAILQERKLELLGEGTRRWDLIRSGKFVEKALAVRAEMTEMVNDLQTKGYHEFANGNVISNYIYTKKVHLSSPLTFDPDESNPALYPGWRGQYDYSTTPVKVTGTDHNLAIEGLFNYIDPNGTEAKKLFDEGYAKVDWGVTLVKYADHYTNSNLLPGVKEGNVPPRYYWPIPFETLSKSKGKITNGYGLAQE